jgi:hypothetical protein
MASNYDEDDYYFDDEFDEYDINPSKVRAGGGGTNRPFHSGKGTRAKETLAAKGIIRTQVTKNETKVEPKKDKKSGK